VRISLFKTNVPINNLTMLLKVTTNGSQMLEDVDNREEKHLPKQFTDHWFSLDFPQSFKAT
jgi:hypothetical protein